MKNIVIIATGGTIAGSGIASSYKTGQIDVNEILATIPRINELASIRLIDFCQKDSNDITEKDWLGLRSLCYALGCDKEVDGIVITHGTDSFEETAYFLNLTLDIDKPVVMTGAMRPATATSADGPMNLYEAVALACRPKAKDAGGSGRFCGYDLFRTGYHQNKQSENERVRYGRCRNAWLYAG